jgi:hypothetical protein
VSSAMATAILAVHRELVVFERFVVVHISAFRCIYWSTSLIYTLSTFRPFCSDLFTVLFNPPVAVLGESSVYNHLIRVIDYDPIGVVNISMMVSSH